MALNGRLVSDRYPYLPIRPDVGYGPQELEALLDTGFDGDVVVPLALIARGRTPGGHHRWTLAGGSEVVAPLYFGMVQLGRTGPFPILITALGDEPILGLGVARRFTITLDHGRRVIVEP